MQRDYYAEYLEALRGDFVKLAKLEFLNHDGSVALTLDNNEKNGRAKDFIQEGSLSCSLNNGRRRQLSVTLNNDGGDFSYKLGKLWYGQEIRYSEGLILPDGTEFYLPQGIFLIEQPTEKLSSNENSVTLELCDKWANIDGTLGGALEGDYFIKAGSHVFTAIATLLELDKYSYASPPKSRIKTVYIDGRPYAEFSPDDAEETTGESGETLISFSDAFTMNDGILAEIGSDKLYAPIDGSEPVFTDYYNGKTQRLTDGSDAPYTLTPYDISQDGSGTIADIVLALTDTLAGLVGYNQAGRLVVDPSQDDISDASKPVLWGFRTDEKELESISASVKISEVYNDVIVVGATLDDYSAARGRAQNLDPSSDTCVSRIGLKTKRIEMPNYYSNELCEAYAAWMLKNTPP